MNTENERQIYVKALQDAVASAKKTSDLRTELSKVNEEFSKRLKKPGSEQLSMELHTQYSGVKEEPSLRVTTPTRTVVSAEISDAKRVNIVDFYLTRLRSDGRVETRHLGKNRYQDGDGRFGITFATERFERSPSDPLLLHAEAFDEAGRLVAMAAVAAHP